jgi:dephospho-CoA kinase
MKIAFVGHAAVGKDTLSDYASQKLNLTPISSSDLIRDHIRNNNLGDTDRENCRNVGNALRAEYGGDYLVHLALSKQAGNIAIGGLRTVDEIETFKSFGGIVVAVTAPPRRRYELAQMRKHRDDDHVTFEAWEANQIAEYSNSDAKRQNIEGVIAMADYHIENTGTLEELYKKCDGVLDQIK